MRTRNPNYDRARDAVLGRTSPGRAGSRGITFRDATTTAHPVVDVSLSGITLTDNEDGTVTLTVGTEEGVPPDGSEVPYDHDSMGATETIDIDNGSWHRGTLDADCTITVQGFTVDEGLVVVVEITQDGAGGHAIVWDADIDWGTGDDQPDQDGNALSIFLLVSSAGDSAIVGAKLGGASSSASSASGAHVHVVGESFVGNGAATVFYLAQEAELDTVAAYNGSGARVAITQDATELDKITFGSAPAAGTGWFDYIPMTT